MFSVDCHLIQVKSGNRYYADEFKRTYSSYLDWFTQPEGAIAEGGTAEEAIAIPAGPRTHRAALLDVSGDFSVEQSAVAWPEEVRTMVGRELKNLLLKVGNCLETGM